MKRSERGQTLIETVVVVGIVGLIAAFSVSLASNGSAGKLSASRRVLESAMNQTVSVAGSTGNGATLYVTPTSNGATLQVFAGRPNGILPDAGTTTLVHTSTVPLGLSATGQNLVATDAGPAFGIFVDSFGRASYGPWAGPGSPPTAPVCSVAGASLILTLEPTAPPETSPMMTMRIACGGNALLPYDAAGNEMPDLAVSQQ